MRTTCLIIACLACGLTACASDVKPVTGFGPTGSIATTASVLPAAGEPAPGQMPRKTMSDRVLAAIALERVTGLKPDPARFTQP